MVTKQELTETKQMAALADPVTVMAAKIATKTFSELAARLANSVVEAAAKPLTAVYEAITTNFEPHLKVTFARCTKVKTILNREEPADLLALYVGLQFKCGKINFDDFGVIDEIHSRKRVVISGTGGGGKTFFMKYFWLSVFENSRGKIPVFVELRKLNEITNDNLLAYVYRTIVNTNSNVSDEAFRKAIRGGIFTFLFDGYDELARDKRESIAKQILELAANNPECTIVISSRPDDLFQSWQAFSTFNVQPLTQEQVLSLIEKIKYDDDAKKKFSERIKRDLWNRHRSFLSSPLLATMMLMTFSQFADIPSKVHLFYDQAFDTLFYKHDAVKELYQRKMHSNLTSDLFRKYFSLFCLVSYYDHAVEFSEQEIRKYIEKGIRIEGDTVDIEAFLRDLTESICIMQKDGANYVFSHRSFQEYFAAFCLDRVLQPHAKAILDKIALRVSDTTVPMLLDMNKDLVEKSFILPFAEKMHTEVGEPRKSGFVERYFVACDSSMYLEFSESKLVEWDIHPGAAETLTQTILRLYPHLYEDVGTRSYHELDEEVIAGFFPGWDPRKRRRLQSQRRSSERDKVTKLTIRARKVDKSPAKFFSSLNGESVPKTHDLSWIAKLGYAKYCRDSIAALYKIEADILSRRKAKVENIEDLLR